MLLPSSIVQNKNIAIFLQFLKPSKRCSWLRVERSMACGYGTGCQGATQHVNVATAIQLVCATCHVRCMAVSQFGLRRIQLWRLGGKACPRSLHQGINTLLYQICENVIQRAFSEMIHANSDFSTRSLKMFSQVTTHLKGGTLAFNVQSFARRWVARWRGHLIYGP